MKNTLLIILALVGTSYCTYAQNIHESGGNVGIGTTTPDAKLEIAGQVNSKYNSTDEYWLRHTDLSDNMIAGLKRQGNSLLIRAYDGINFSVNNTENPVLNISQGGNVGIGVTSAAEKLSVNGKIRAHEIKVELANWPDYVFAKEYQLPTLQETEKHIKEKGHLPGIPSAEEVKAHGVDLGEMNAKLLQKIEELTLHLIEIKKENEKQEILNQQYQMDIKLLKSKISQ